MPTNMETKRVSSKGEQVISQGFIAQYAAEATMRTPGVVGMDVSSVSLFKNALGYEHEGAGVKVEVEKSNNLLELTVYPRIYYGVVAPDVAWEIQLNVKRDVEKYTGLPVGAVNVHIVDVLPIPYPEPPESSDSAADTDEEDFMEEIDDA